MRRDQADGLPGPATRLHGTGGGRVMDARYGLAWRDESTIENRRILADRHVIPCLGGRRLADLLAEAWALGWPKGSHVVNRHRASVAVDLAALDPSGAGPRRNVRRNVALLC